MTCPNCAELERRLSNSQSEVAALTAQCGEMDKALSAIYAKATSTLLTKSRDIGDWIDDVEAIGLLAANED